MQISVKDIKKLRELTGAGMLDCKKALEDKNGDIDEAIKLLREKGILKAQKKASRIASEGIIASYVHGGRIGVIVEINTETDFVAKNQEFIDFSKDISMQIAASSPKFVSIEDVPKDEVENEKEILRAQALNEGKPEKIVEKMVEGRINKFFEENCLLEQPFIKDNDKSIKTLLDELRAKIGENINIRRFTRYELGEGLEKKEENFAEEVAKQL